MTDRRPDHPDGMTPDGAIPDELVDRFFDNQLDQDARRAFLRSLPADQCEEVARTRRMLDALRTAPVHAPDLTGRIIAAVDQRRGFASRHVRKAARIARFALAASLVLVVGAVAAVQRVAPDATRLAPAPAPLTSAFRQTEAEVASNLGSIASTFEVIQQQVTPTASVRVVQRVRHEHADAGRSVATLTLAAGAPQTDQHHTMLVGLRLGPKSQTSRILWSTSDQAVAAPAEACEVSHADPSPRVPRRASVGFIDAEGRCSVLVMPLGVERLGRDDLAAPFVLPGQPVARPARPAELLIRASQP